MPSKWSCGWLEVPDISHHIVYIQRMGLAFYKPQKDLYWDENQWFQVMSQNLSEWVTDWLTDELQEMPELLSATKNKPNISNKNFYLNVGNWRLGTPKLRIKQFLLSMGFCLQARNVLMSWRTCSLGGPLKSVRHQGLTWRTEDDEVKL